MIRNKIAYILELDPILHLGVYKKIMLQADNLRSNGADVKVIIISPRACEIEGVEIVNTFNCFNGVSLFSRAVRVFNRIISSTQLISRVDAFNPDHIYYREGVSFRGVKKVLQTYDSTIEVNSPIDINEGGMNRFLYALYYYQRINLLSLSEKFVSISYEVEENLIKNGFSNIKTICNGFNLDKYLNCQEMKSAKVKCLMVGSPHQAWQGFDEFLMLANEFIGNEQYSFYIAGIDNREIACEVGNNVKLLGYLSEDELKQAINDADLCFGTLAAYRKNINEVSSLKHRLYVEHKKPIVACVRDTDFSENPFYLELPNVSNSLLKHVNKIAEFAERSKKESLYSSDISHLSEKAKSKVRLKFIIGK